MTSLGLALLLPFPSPPGLGAADGGSAALARAANRAWLPLIDALAEGALPQGSLSIHLGGEALRWMERHAAGSLDTLLALVKEGRVEVLGGPWAGAILPSIPERDAAAQVQELSRWWRTRVGASPRGAWLPWEGWDPAAPRVLGRLGVQYVVLRDTQVAPAVRPDGWWLTEREGTRLGIFASDTRIGAMLGQQPPAKVLRAVAQRGREGVRCVVVVPPREALCAEEGTPAFAPRGWGRKFLAALADASHWIKLIDFTTVMDRMAPAGRIYPPPSLGLPPSPGAGGTAWEWVLASHPEVDRLHKRMLRTSAEVHRLQAALKGTSGEDPRVRTLEDATRALWYAQDGHAYVLNTPRGAQDPDVRHAAWASLLRAEEAVARSFGEHGRVRCEQVDDDCDGQSEIEVRTAKLRGVVAPGHGGALVELDVWGLGNVLNVRTRRAEAVHVQVASNLRDEDDDEKEPTHGVVTRPFLRGAPIWLDVHLRASFVDHFLPAHVDVSAMTGRWIDAGDFVGRPYRLLHLDDEGSSDVVVGLAREGNVTDGTSFRLVRVLKRYAFARDGSSIAVRYEIANRFDEPIRARFAVAFNLGLDGVNPAARLVVDGAEAPIGEPVSVDGVREVMLRDGARRAAIGLRSAQPARVWHAALTTTSLGASGPTDITQGVAVLYSWPIDLAPGQKVRHDVTLVVRT